MKIYLTYIKKILLSKKCALTKSRIRETKNVSALLSSLNTVLLIYREIELNVGGKKTCREIFLILKCNYFCEKAEFILFQS